ncbi:hypothetical protein [Aquiflexum sp.]|uniref:hypothetical protein n=1 Tax=Aquiflexum sp. TaxID=1872584 RepID=UPI0035942E35
MQQQIVDIWKYLHLNDVRYLTIGGFAVNIYGYNRSTNDIDILIEDTLENRQNLRKAFKDMGLGDFEQIERLQFLPGWTDFSLNDGFKLDIMTSIKGLENIPFESLYQNANVIDVEKIPVYFIDYKSLIIAKKATNRLKDQLDLEELQKINPQERPED